MQHGKNYSFRSRLADTDSVGRVLVVEAIK